MFIPLYYKVWIIHDVTVSLVMFIPLYYKVWIIHDVTEGSSISNLKYNYF